MTITNKTLAWGIVIMMWLFCLYYAYSFWFMKTEIESNGAILLSILSHLALIAGLITLLIRLFENSIKFEFKISNPFSQAIKLYKEKKEAAKAIDGIYMKIAQAEKTEEIDLLLKKIEAIKRI